MKTSGSYPRVSLAFARKIDTNLIAFSRNVITLMTGNDQYPTPSPTLKAVGTAVDALEVAVHDALDGGKIASPPGTPLARSCSRFSVSSLRMSPATAMPTWCCCSAPDSSL